MNYCKKCNITESEGAKFCPKCGAKLISEISYYGLKYSQGDINAFEKVYALSFRAVQMEVRNYLMNMNDQDREDCVQEVYLKLSTNIHSFDEEKASFNTWFQTLRRNVMNTFVESASTKKNTMIDRSDDMEVILQNEMSGDEAAIPGLVYEKKECRDLLIEMLEQVPKEQRDCIIKFFLEHTKQSEIAQSFGIPVGTVKSRLSQGKMALKNIVLDYENRGVVLRSAAPFTFFLALVEGSEVQASELTQFGTFMDFQLPPMSDAIKKVVGIDTVSLSTNATPLIDKAVRGTNIAESSTLSTGIKVTLVKMVTGVAIIASVVIGGIGYLQKNNNVEQSTIEPQEEVSVLDDEHRSGYVEPEFEIYEEVIEAYEELFNGGDPFSADSKINQLILKEEMPEVDEYGYLRGKITGYSNPYTGHAQHTKNEENPHLYYGLYDINGDGIKELFTSVDPSDYEKFISVPTFDIWTIKDGQAEWLTAVQYRDQLYINADGVLMFYGSAGIFYYGFRFYEIVDDELVLLSSYDYEGEENDNGGIDYEVTATELEGTEYIVSEITKEEADTKEKEFENFVLPIKWFTEIKY